MAGEGMGTMTGRERLTAVMHKQPVDRPAWTTLVDSATLGLLPGSLYGMGVLDFYRHIGCDIFSLNGWCLPHNFKSPQHRWGDEVVTRTRKEDGHPAWEWQTPRGTLTATPSATRRPSSWVPGAYLPLLLQREGTGYRRQQ